VCAGAGSLVASASGNAHTLRLARATEWKRAKSRSIPYSRSALPTSLRSLLARPVSRVLVWALHHPDVRETHDPRRYLTIDSWETDDQRTAMLAASQLEYAQLDHEHAGLTESEVELGVFTIVSG
jgi:hypothetical protein